MRVLAILVGLVGVLGAGFMAFAVNSATQKIEKENPGDKMGPELKQRWGVLKNTATTMIAAVVLGVVGVVLAAGQRGKVAAVAFLVAYAAPIGVLASGIKVDPSDDIVKLMLGVPGGLAIAAVLSLLIAPKLAHSRVRQAEARGD
jgi:hypothetical protein